MSDDKAEEIKRNVLSPAQWIRILYMAFYAVACWVLLFVLPVIIVCQIIISLITGIDNRNLRDFGKALSDYFHQALNYLVYVSDDKPWPFSDGEDLGDFHDDFNNDSNNDADSEKTDEEPVISTPANAPESTTGNEAHAEGTGDDVFSDISFTGDEAGDVRSDSEADDRADDRLYDDNDDDRKGPA